MLRIVFTSQDVARTRVAATPDPLWELVLSLQMLRGQPGDLLFTGWRRTTAATIRRTGLGRRIRTMTTVIPQTGYFPDFLNPVSALAGLDYGLETIKSTPKLILHRDLEQFTNEHGLMPAIKTLAQGGSEALTSLTDAMQGYYNVAIAPHQHSVNADLDKDRSIRATQMMKHGVDGLLASFQPHMTWAHNELHIPAHRDQVVHLDGRGLIMVPSFFCVNHPVTMFDDSLQPVLIYPMHRSGPPFSAASAPLESVSALIGHTRAAILHAVGNGCSTKDLAARAGVSMATASEHATILRNSRLITTHRDRSTSVHQLTALGRALLNSS